MGVRPPGNAAFTRYWIAETLLALGQEIFMVAVGWQIYDLTNSALSLGLIGLAQFLPQCLLALVAGHFADSFDRRRITTVCQMVKFSATATLAVGSLTGTLGSALIYACTAAFGASHTFQQPALRALMPTLVERGILPQCIAWNSGVRKAAIIAGPAIGGLIYLIGPVPAYAASALCFLCAGIFLAGIRLAHAALPSREPMTLQSLFGGIAFIRSKRVILGAISLDLFAVLLGGATALLPVFARDILDVGAGGQGMLLAAMGGGAVVSSIMITLSGHRWTRGKVMLDASLIYGLMAVALAVSPYYWSSLLVMALAGLCHVHANALVHTVVQTYSSAEYRGRSMALFNMSQMLSTAGSMVIGVLAAWLGPRGAVAAMGMAGAAGILLLIVLMPAARKIK